MVTTLLIQEAACRHGAYHHFESLYIVYKYISGEDGQPPKVIIGQVPLSPPNSLYEHH